jgi:3-phosphoshikimate 1-carboxyvinyltransferase
MASLLKSNDDLLDAGAAGTTFRFLTALHAILPRSITLTGSERMRERPIGVLVDALRLLGANIEYQDKEGFPPLRIHAPDKIQKNSVLIVPASTSSQYISALLMIAPALPQGLTIELQGTIVSRPYLEMTLRLMQVFGVTHFWEDSRITVPPQEYMPAEYMVEADWSAASYFYSMAAFSEYCELKLNGLFKDSLQGDSVLPAIMQPLGVDTIFGEDYIILRKSAQNIKKVLEWDFLPSPDLAQSVAVTCGGLKVQGIFSGLQTLHIKETDRIAALMNELAKIEVSFSLLPQKSSRDDFSSDYYLLAGEARIPENVLFETYEDHRMAMAFAPLAMFGEIGINKPQVVEKSYPGFWDDLIKLGFKIESF